MRDGRLFLWSLCTLLSCGRSIGTLSGGAAGKPGQGMLTGTGGAQQGSGAHGAAGSAHGASGGKSGSGEPSDGGAGLGDETDGTGTLATGRAGSTAQAGRAGSGGHASASASGGFGETLHGAGSGGFGGEPELDEPCVVHVSQASGSDDNDGKTWATAVATVTRGLELSDFGCELWLTRATYLPGTTRAASFRVTHGETLRGGFSGTETTPDQRVDAANETLLSGELGDVDSVDDNAFHVVTTGGSTFDRIDVSGGNANDSSEGGGGILSSGGVLLEGCSIHDNRAAGSGGGVLAHAQVTIEGSSFTSNVAGERGGSVAALGSDPLTIENAVFTAGTAAAGGAVYTSSSRTDVMYTTFQQNQADTGGALEAPVVSGTLTIGCSTFDSNEASDGGAILTLAPLTLTWASFSNNRTLAGSGIVSVSGPTEITSSGFYGNTGSALLALGSSDECSVDVKSSTFASNGTATGAGIRADGCQVTLTGTAFADNAAVATGGAISVHAGALTLTDSWLNANAAGTNGGALHVDSSTLSVVNTTIAGSSAQYGAALYLLDTDDVVITRSRLTANSAVYEGGGIFVWGSGSLALGDSELAGNTAIAGAALYRRNAINGTSTTLTNVTLTENVAESGAAIDSAGALVIRNSILWADEPAELLLDSSLELTLASSNLSGDAASLAAFDPHFVDTLYDLRLASDSPCIDSADDAYASTSDIAAHARFDVPSFPTCPSEAPSCGSVADMGAHEYGY